MNRLQQLTSHGQSIWLDYIRRQFVTDGSLKKLIDEDALTGLTSNPAIFDQAIREGAEYEEAIRRAAESQQTPEQTFRMLSVADVQLAADALRGVYDATEAADGYVSLEVSPHLARDTEGSIAEARALWQEVDRPNLMVKIPGTLEGLPAIRRLIAEGINVNVTLLFSLSRFRMVTEAYLAGLEDRKAEGKPLDRVASVASFFLSRIDLAVAERLADHPPVEQALARQAAIASARQAYQIYGEIKEGDRYRRLAQAGARPQRLLWASTSTKNPDERDVRYVEALIGPETVNTLPPKTLEAFRDHGDPAPRLTEGLVEAGEVLAMLEVLGHGLEDVARQLEEEGIEKFIKPFDRLLAELARKLSAQRKNAAAAGVQN